MFPAKFAYAAPSSLQEALDLLQDPDAKFRRGAHGRLRLMKLRLAQPKLLVDLGRIPGLSYVRSENGSLAIGAMTNYPPIHLSNKDHQPAPAPRHTHLSPDPAIRRSPPTRPGAGRGSPRSR